MVLVVENPAKVGIKNETIVKPASISEEELLNLINNLNNDNHTEETKICNAVSPDKVIDGFHIINIGGMCLDQYSMEEHDCGWRSNVGMPIAMLSHTDGMHGYPGVRRKTSYITPIPGGVVPMAVVMLMKNNYCCKKGTEA
ncbi:unnamed protein product [Nyctereutes procyonoides]|uniref:(raccoon dog) hypothetical protein n=1 Tax=Nyctereutes procyonoides TaxID=34880 RepID=A0A811Y081_NYCPR|nr:unnamed protein product [Nyctereutes procyonoides]